jgi:L-ascorbate metabolism protein UlaG (beta-lactamase superfamily)
LIKLCWHGGATLAVRLGGQEFLLDPVFAPVPAGEPGGDAAAPGRTRVGVVEALTRHWPDVVLISHGHTGHCDLATVRRLAMARPVRWLTTAAVAAVLARECAIPPRWITAVEPGEAHAVGRVRIETFAGEHWFSGERGERMAADGTSRVRLVAGGPSLGFRLVAGADRVYVSGDTTLPGIPAVDAPVAVLSFAGPTTDPLTGQAAQPILAPADVVPAARRLQAQVVVPLHWDRAGSPEEAQGVLRAIRAELERGLPGVRLAVLPYGQWVAVA